MSEGINYYEGRWNNDQFDGFGTYKRTGKTVKNFWEAKGTWVNGKLDEGKVEYRKGEIYEGKFDITVGRHGKGIMYYKDGSYYDGNWSNDQKHGTGVLGYGHKEFDINPKLKNKTKLRHDQVWIQHYKEGKLIKEHVIQKSSLNQKNSVIKQRYTKSI